MTEGHEVAVERFVRSMQQARLFLGWSQERLSAELQRRGTALNASSITKIEWLLDPKRRSVSRPVRLVEALAIAAVLEQDFPSMLFEGAKPVEEPPGAMALKLYRESLQMETELRIALAGVEESTRLFRSQISFLPEEATSDGEHPEEA